MVFWATTTTAQDSSTITNIMHKLFVNIPDVLTWWEIPSIVHFCDVFSAFCEDLSPINITVSVFKNTQIIYFAI